MRNETVTLTRRHLSGAAGFIGGVALLAGVLGLLWQGSIAGYVAVALGVGVAGLALWALLNPGDFIGLVTGRQARYGTVAIASTLLLTGIVVMTYLLAARNTLTFDLTFDRRFTLSSETDEVLRLVNRPIQITGFYTSAALTQRELDDQIIRLYETQTDGLIRRVYIDPDEQPALAAQYGVSQDAQLFISFLNEDGSVDLGSLQRIPRGTRQERDITEAISRLLVAGSITVYFETSKGERDTLSSAQDGLSGINSGIQESGLITQALNLTALAEENQPVPEDASAVIMARPLYELTEGEIAVIDDYLQRGGALFIMTDVLFTEDAFLNQDSAFNAYLWENYGIRALDAVVVDPASSGQTALDVVAAEVYTGTEISERYDPRAPLEFRLVRALDTTVGTAPENVANGRIAFSSPASFGETNLQRLGETNTFGFDEGADLPGPLPLVVWAWNQETDARILLTGDSDFVTNGTILSGGNSVLFTDGLSWLTGYSERIRFAPQEFFYGLPLISVSQQTLDAVAFVTMILIPGAMLVAALAVWLRRARA